MSACVCGKVGGLRVVTVRRSWERWFADSFEWNRVRTVSKNTSRWLASKPQVTPSILQHDGASREVVPAQSAGLQQSMPQSGEKAKAGAPMRLRARTAMTSMLKNLFDMAVLIIINRGRI